MNLTMNTLRLNRPGYNPCMDADLMALARRAVAGDIDALDKFAAGVRRLHCGTDDRVGSQLDAWLTKITSRLIGCDRNRVAEVTWSELASYCERCWLAQKDSGKVRLKELKNLLERRRLCLSGPADCKTPNCPFRRKK